MLDISIIIVSWNTREFTRQCLSSIRQNCGGLRTEIFVVDNASSDGTAEMIEQDFPEVHLIRNSTNAGFAKANNAGLRQASGKYICLINSDVTVLPGCLGKMFAYMEQNGSVGMLGPQMLNPDGTVGPSCMRRPTLAIWLVSALGLSSVFKNEGLHIENMNSALVQHVDVLNGWFWMVRRSALEQVGLLDERFFMYGEDIDWCHRFWENRWKIVYFPDAASIHHGEGSSARAPVRFYVEMQRANLQYWKQHHNVISQAVYVLIVTLHQVLRVFGYCAVYAVRPLARSEAWFKIQRSTACLRWLFGLWHEQRAAAS